MVRCRLGYGFGQIGIVMRHINYDSNNASWEAWAGIVGCDLSGCSHPSAVGLEKDVKSYGALRKQ